MTKKAKIYLGPPRHAKPRRCPGCDESLDGTFYAGSRPTDQPDIKVGDMSICAHCSTISVVTEDGLRLATQAEFDSMDDEIKKLIQHFPAHIQTRKD